MRPICNLRNKDLSEQFMETLYEQEAQDLASLGGRLALELECLLLDSSDIASVSKWWGSAHEALDAWRKYLWGISNRPSGELIANQIANQAKTSGSPIEGRCKLCDGATPNSGRLDRTAECNCQRQPLDGINVFRLIEDNGLTLHGDIEHFAYLVANSERERIKMEQQRCYVAKGGS
jgi:hypothetical protein